MKNQTIVQLQKEIRRLKLERLDLQRKLRQSEKEYKLLEAQHQKELNELEADHKEEIRELIERYNPHGLRVV